MNILEKIFKTSKPLIGMIHFPPLVGYPEHPGFEYIAQKMLKEAKILENAKFDGIIIENNYDVPHTEKVPQSAAKMFEELARLLEKNTTLPFGLDILWNDFETSLAICDSTRASFFRVPAFVDSVVTTYGPMKARSKEVILLRKKMNLDSIGIFADIQVKHSEMVDKNKPLSQSAKEAVAAGADAIIVTGKWTGDAPKTDDLIEARSAIGDFPILIGSGATSENLSILTKYADGIIVGTALKEGENQDREKEVNLKPFESSIDSEKATQISTKYALYQSASQEKV